MVFRSQWDEIETSPFENQEPGASPPDQEVFQDRYANVD